MNITKDKLLPYQMYSFAYIDLEDYQIRYTTNDLASMTIFPSDNLIWQELYRSVWLELLNDVSLYNTPITFVDGGRFWTLEKSPTWSLKCFGDKYQDRYLGNICPLTPWHIGHCIQNDCSLPDANIAIAMSSTTREKWTSRQNAIAVFSPIDEIEIIQVAKLEL
jgi:hypothetical protein